VKKLILIFGLIFSTISAQDKVPNMRLKMINGKYAKLYDFLKDGPMIIDFWATWCEPCKKQMRYLDLFYNHFKSTRFNILTVNTDSPKSMSKVKPYVRTKGFEFHVAVDPNSQLKKRLKVQQMPTTILIDQDGTILYRHKGYVPGDEVGILKAITDILDKKEIKYATLDLDKVQTINKKGKLDIDF
jgi:peroxiredoxin